MAIGYFIRSGDRTTCGGTVLEGDDRVIMAGLPQSCEGHAVTCGKDNKVYVILGGIPSMVCHTRQAAGTLDSFSSCPCQARLIPSELAATYTSDQNNSSRTSNRSAQTLGTADAPTSTGFHLADPGRTSAAPTLLVQPPATDNQNPIESPVVCNHPDQMEELASYIADEMNRNISHPSVTKMRALNSFDALTKHAKHQELPWYARLTPPNFQATELVNKAAAMALWAERVGQNRPWDHKPKIRTTIGGVWHKFGKYEYFYDIWSNIHYGYVGVACGFSESLLLDGAGVEQIASDSIRKIQKWDESPGPYRSSGVQGMRAWDDPPDRVSIIIGMTLYKEYPNGGLTAKIIMDMVLAIPMPEWVKGIQEHVCK
ncbi:MAG: polymorphic toxin type 44 domain-containing protein [Pseudomonas sp.]